MTNPDHPSTDAPIVPGALATGYQRQSGEMMVYGGTFFGLFFLLGATMSGEVTLFVLAILMLGAAFYFFPMIRGERAQLRVEARGLYLDGMGWLPWTGIRDVRMFDRAVRTIRNAHLELTLAGPIEDIVRQEDKQDPLRDMMTKIWTLRRHADASGGHHVLVRLEPLKATPEEILAAIRRYLPDV